MPSAKVNRARLGSAKDLPDVTKMVLPYCCSAAYCRSCATYADFVRVFHRSRVYGPHAAGCHKIKDCNLSRLCQQPERFRAKWATGSRRKNLKAKESNRPQSAHGFSPRAMRSEISAWNAGGPKANQSSFT